MYEVFYGLSEKPFNLTPDPSFLYLSEKHKEAFAHLLYGIRSRCGFVMVSGEIGTGKTTICRSLLSRLDPDTEVAFIFNPSLSPRELLWKINEDFGIESRADTIKGLIDELNEYLLACAAKGKNCVLVIDEAQNLNPSVLEQVRMLSNLETERQKLLQIVLIGQPELAEMLELPQLRQLNQRITARYHLKELNRQETLHYIAFRLRVAGGKRQIRFSRSAVRTIYKLSGGTPRMINAICDRALLIGFTEEQHKITPRIVRKAIKEIRGDKVRPKRSAAKGGRTFPASAYVTALAALVCGAILFFPERDRVFEAGSRLFDRSRELLVRGGERMTQSNRAEAIVSESLRVAAETSIADIPAAEPAPVETVVPASADIDPADVPTESVVEDSEVSGNVTIVAEVPSLEAPAISEVLEETEADLAPAPAIADVSGNEAHAPVELSELLANVDAATLRNSGLATVFAQWDAPVPNTFPKGSALNGVRSFANEHGLSLVALNADFDQVLTVNLPAIIQLRGATQDVWAGLLRVDGTEAHIGSFNDLPHRVAVEDIRSDYTGKVVFLWVDPAPDAAILLPWQSGDEIAQMQDQLRLLGLLDGETYGTFDRKTINAVRRVQRATGLLIDGVVGVQTRMVLTSWLEMKVTPRLLPEAFPVNARMHVLNQDGTDVAMEKPGGAMAPVAVVAEGSKFEDSIAIADAGTMPQTAVSETPVDTHDAELGDDDEFVLEWSEPEINEADHLVVIRELTEPGYEPALDRGSVDSEKSVTDSAPGMYPLVPSAKIAPGDTR